jgi:hypothetical protein
MQSFHRRVYSILAHNVCQVSLPRPQVQTEPSAASARLCCWPAPTAPVIRWSARCTPLGVRPSNVHNRSLNATYQSCYTPDMDSCGPWVGRLTKPAHARKLMCPCCGYWTLSERGTFEICAECGWEDDGQDDADADVVRGGPNGALSLTAAREHYRNRLNDEDR